MSIKQDILKYSRQEKLHPLSSWFDSNLSDLIDDGTYSDQNVLEETGRKLISGLIAYANTYKISTAVIGMSGGVDSALTAALFKCAGWRVIGITMPIHQREEETERGIAACNALKLEHKHIDLSKTYDSLLKSVQNDDADIVKTENSIRRGNLRVRLRMMTLYNQASLHRGLVGSTDNFSELATGFWTLHGDVGDVAPIQSLLKSWEVPKLAEIYDVPTDTVFATPTDGLGISNGDEDQFGFSYLELDIVLMKLCSLMNQGYSLTEAMANLDIDASDVEKVNKILGRIRGSRFKRQNPYNLNHPIQPNRFNGLKNIDIQI
jgi:nicotinamide-nucleotide amidase